MSAHTMTQFSDGDTNTRIVRKCYGISVCPLQLYHDVAVISRIVTESVGDTFAEARLAGSN